MDWQRRYAENITPWDLRQPTPPLEELLGSGRLRELGVPDDAHVAIPGCGRGHDLRAWVRAGYRATGFDIAPLVVDEARDLLRWNAVERAEVFCRDLFGLGLEFAAQFDVVYDYTCFCAIPRHLRSAYGREIAAITRPGGWWVGLAFPIDPALTGTDGPPYLVGATDLEDALSADFELRADFDAERSVAERRGAERWFLWRRRC